jgi:hypothetical protein
MPQTTTVWQRSCHRPPAQHAAVVEVPHLDAAIIGRGHQPPLLLVKADGSHAAGAMAPSEATAAAAVLQHRC